MATPCVLTFDAEGRAVDFEVWVDDLQLILHCDRADGLSLFDLTSGASPAPPATADSTVRSQWATRDAAARLAMLARYSSPATAALSRLMLPYLFPDLAAFPTVADLITHLRTSDTRYRAALPAEFCAQNPPSPMYITLYYIVTRLPDSLRIVRDHFLSVCPTTLTVDLLEQRLLAAETSIVAVGASRGDPRTPVFEGCFPSPLLPSVASSAAADLGGFEALVGLAGAVEVVVVAVEGVGVVVGVVAGVEVSAAAVEAEEAAEAAEGEEVAEVAEAAEAAVELVAALRRGVALVAVSASSSSAIMRPRPPSSFVSGTLGVSAVVVLVPAPTFSVPNTTLFPDATEIPRWGDLSRAGVAIFDLDYDAILAAMYAVSTSDEGDCNLCLPPDPGGEAAALGTCEAAALGASASAAPGAGECALSGIASAQVFHTFTLDSGASRSFFQDRTTLPPLRRPVAVSLADPSGGPVLASFSTVLPCLAAPSGTLSGLYLPSFSTNLVSGADLQDRGVDQFTPASQRVTHCTCARTGRHLATFTRRPGSSLYTLSTESPPVPASGQPRVSLPETSPTLRWTGKVGDASAFRVWGSRAFVRDLSADKLSPCAVPCVFLGFPPDAPGWQFYHPTSRRVLSSQDVTFDKSVPYYCLFPYRTAPLPPPPLFLAPGSPPVDPLPPQGPAPSGVSQVDAVKPVEVAVDSSAARGAEPVGAGSGGAESGGAEPRGAMSGGAEPRGAEPGGAEPGGAESARVASRSASRAAGAGGPLVVPGPGGARTGGTGAIGTGGAAAAAGVGPAGASGAAGAGATGDIGAGVGAAVASGAAGAGAAGGVGSGVGPARGTAGAAGGTGAAGPAGVRGVGAGGAAGAGAATGGTGAVPVGTGGPARPRPYFVPLLEQVLGLPPSLGPAPPLECLQPVQSQLPLQPVSPLPAPSPYAGPTGGLAECREPASRPASPVCTTRTSRRAPRPRPPAVPGTHQMTLRPSTALGHGCLCG
ncbi:unnamed protein product [Closterium sp. NIES-53]